MGAAIAAATYSSNTAIAAGTYSNKTKMDIDNALASDPIVLFSATYCPHCVIIKKILKPYEPYTVIEVDTLDEVGRNGPTFLEYKAYLSQVTGLTRILWPRLFIGGKCVGGSDDTTILDKSGELDKLINDAKKAYNV